MRARHDHAHARPQESMPEFRVSLTTKFIHENCGCGLFPLNVFRCRIPALFPAVNLWPFSQKTDTLVGVGSIQRASVGRAQRAIGHAPGKGLEKKS